MSPSPLPAIPQERYVRQVLDAARRLELESDRLLQHHDLTLAQFNILNHLRHHQPMAQSDLVMALAVGKATVSALVGNLLKRHLVILTPDEKDRRVNTLQLSADGTLLWHAASKAYIRGLKKRMPKIRAAEVEALSRALAVASGQETRGVAPS